MSPGAAGTSADGPEAGRGGGLHRARNPLPTLPSPTGRDGAMSGRR